MIVKGIVESVKDVNSIKVRIPFLNGLAEQVDSTPTENLPNAQICQMPNTNYRIATGDIVWVNFENTRWENPVIIGFLDKYQNTKISFKADDISVDLKAELPTDTNIGDVDAESLACLKDLRTELAPYFANSMQVYPLDLSSYSSGDEIPISVLQQIPQDAYVIAITLAQTGSRVYWTLLERNGVSQQSNGDAPNAMPSYDFAFYNALYGVLTIEGQRVVIP